MAINRNRDRNRRRPVTVKSPQPEDTAESVIDRVDRLSSRIKQCNHFDSLTIAHARSLLQTVTHLLENSGPDDYSDDEDSDGDSDDDDEDSDSIPPSRKPPLNLRERWSGNLPAAPKPSRQSKPSTDEAARLARRKAIGQLKVNGIAGGLPEDYDVTYDILPHNVCSICRGRADSHSIDHNLPPQKTADGTLLPYIQCDSTRAYMLVPGNPNV